MYYNLWCNGEELPNPYIFNTNSLDDIIFNKHFKIKYEN